jgi:hypothetical protein
MLNLENVMAFCQSSDPSNQPCLPKTSILGIFFFLMGAPHVYAFFNPPFKDIENATMPKLVTLVLTSGVLASLVEWLILRNAGMV